VKRILLAAVPLTLVLACARSATPGDRSEPAPAEPAAPGGAPKKVAAPKVLGETIRGEASSTPPRMKLIGVVGPARPRPAPPRGGRRFWVSPLGLDTHDCSERAPCRQLQRAAALATAPGDVVLVADGTYDHFSITDSRGAPDKPITFYALGDSAVVQADPDCNGKSSCRDNIIVRRSRYVVLDGISTEAAPRAGIAIFYGDHITVRNATLKDNGRWGLFSTFADDVLVERNDIRATRKEHGVYLSNSGDRPIVRANSISDNDGCGIQLNADYREKPETDKSGKSFYSGAADGLITGAVIERNLLFANGSGKLAGKNKRRGAAINLDGVQDSIVQGNVLYDNAATGIVAYGDADGIEDDSGEDGDGRFGPKGVTIVHNTVVMPEGARNALQIRLSAGPNVVQNNILLHRDARRAGLELVTEADAKLVDSDANVLDRVALGEKIEKLDDWKKQLGKDKRSFSAPLARLFADPAQGDFTLVQGSPAAHAGKDIAGEQVDFLGRTRAKGKTHNIGACEDAP